MGNESQQVSIVTGGARGIGAAIVAALADRGDRVVVVDRDSAALEEVPGTLAVSPDAVELVAADVSTPVGWETIVAAAHSRFGAITTLVNNAAISPVNIKSLADRSDTPLDEWNRVLAVNLTGPFLGINAVMPDMKAGGWGRIVNMSSTAGRRGNRKGGMHYGATKAGVLGLTRGYAFELGQFGITVNAIAPGRIMTPLTLTLPDSVNQEVLSEQPVPRFGQPEDIAATARFLTSSEAGFITGATVDVNGGTYMA